MALVAVALKRAEMRRAMAAGAAGLIGLIGLIAADASALAQSQQTETVTRTRPRVVIQPRRVRLSPNAHRECRARLVQEYRVSGTVIVPQTTCWWE